MTLGADLIEKQGNTVAMANSIPGYLKINYSSYMPDYVKRQNRKYSK